MLKLLSLISKNFIIAIPITLLLGFAYGLVAPTAWLKSLIIPLTFLMVYPMMVSLKLAKVLEGGDAKAQVLAQLINFAIILAVVGVTFLTGNALAILGLTFLQSMPVFPPEHMIDRGDEAEDAGNSPIGFVKGLIRERTQAGLAAARARGRAGGRKPKLDDQQVREIKALLRDPNIQVADVARRYGVSRTTLYKHVGVITPRQ